jgi:hypothetical protein
MELQRPRARTSACDGERKALPIGARRGVDCNNQIINTYKRLHASQSQHTHT